MVLHGCWKKNYFSEMANVLVRDLVFSANLKALRHELQIHPELANAEFSLPDNPATAHPLHRICDGVCCEYFSEETGLELARIFFSHGADVNTIRVAGKDSPLTAACSMQCDQLALLYVEHGADVNHPGCHGGTGLHWAAWCGRDVVLKKLVTLNHDINQLCLEFKSTPLFWAVHGHRFGGKNNQHHQFECARILLEHGADPAISNFEGYIPKQVVEDHDVKFLELFK